MDNRGTAALAKQVNSITSKQMSCFFNLRHARNREIKGTGCSEATVVIYRSLVKAAAVVIAVAPAEIGNSFQSQHSRCRCGSNAP